MAALFLDTNVFLDAILKRTASFQYSEQILILAQDRTISIVTSASCLVNAMYFLNKAGISKQDTAEIILELLKVTALVATDARTFSIALNSEFTDLEDAVQYYTALNVGSIDYFITSNIKDYTKELPQLPVLTPQQFISLFNRK